MLFETYLKKQFDTEITKDNSTYVLVADQACSGCAKYVFDNAKSPPEHYIFILPKPENDYKYDHKNVLIDSSGMLGRLKFHKGNVCTIKTQDGILTEVKVYDPSEVMNLINESH
ncbi:hypothetical protein D3C72_2020990 [compost metagenome]